MFFIQILLFSYVGYPLEQVRHISYQLSYAVKVCLTLTIFRSHNAKDSIEVIYIHVSFCCFPIVDSLSSSLALRLIWSTTPHQWWWATTLLACEHLLNFKDNRIAVILSKGPSTVTGSTVIQKAVK